MRQVCAHMDLWFQVSASNSSRFKPRNIGPRSNRHASSIIVRESLAQLHLIPLRRRGRLSRKNLGKERKNPMAISPLAGKPAPKEMLVDLAKLERKYYERRPDMGDPNQLVSFGTSGHRG